MWASPSHVAAEPVAPVGGAWALVIPRTRPRTVIGSAVPAGVKSGPRTLGTLDLTFLNQADAQNDAGHPSARTQPFCCSSTAINLCSSVYVKLSGSCQT